MASEWEMAMGVGVELGMGMGTYHHHHNASSVTGAGGAPMGHHGGGYAAAAHCFYGMQPMGGADGGAMRVDELLDLSSGGAHDFFPVSAAAADNGHHHLGAGLGEPSATTQSATSSDHQTSMLSFADEFYIPSEEAAELEWLSKFVDDSYSDMPNYSSAAHAAMAAAAAATAASNGGGSSAGQDSCITAVPGRGARSKRARASAAAAAAWHSLMPRPPSQSSPSSSCSSSDFPSSNKPARPSGSSSSRGKKSPAAGGAVGVGEVGLVEGGVRRCTHCASEKTPQWRTGPLGPKTLCNACGVRFKSGRLVPEYRPAASPTFLLTQHSNSHRKVMELRRQKELILIRGSHRVDAAAAASAAAGPAGGTVKPELMFRDYGIC